MKKTRVWKNMGPVHKIAVPRRIDAAMLKQYGWPEKEPSVRFEFKKTLKLAKLPPTKLPPDALLRLSCGAVGKKLGYKGKAVPAAGIDVRPPRNFAELKRVNRLAHKVFLKTWGKKIGGFFLDATNTYETRHLPKTRSLIVVRKRKPVALFSLLKFKIKAGTADIATWHCAFAKLSPAELRSAFHQAAVWMDREAKHRVIVGVEFFDKESIRFFSMLGFKVDRIRVVRI
ncbi:MAG TPA: hypothetical protein PKK31_09985 [Elusimicrobiales bacterium]|nr:hypothetical protein [Elusimicrobiales bacterium]